MDLSDAVFQDDQAAVGRIFVVWGRFNVFIPDDAYDFITFVHEPSHGFAFNRLVDGFSYVSEKYVVSVANVDC